MWWKETSSMCLSTTDFRQWSSLSSTWKGCFLALSCTKCDIRSLHFKKQEAFSLQTYPRQSLLEFYERSYIFHRNEHRLDHMLSIYTTNSDWSKLKKVLFVVSLWNWKLVPVPGRPRNALNFDHLRNRRLLTVFEAFSEANHLKMMCRSTIFLDKALNNGFFG